MFGLDFPWKLVGIGLAALAIIGVITAGTLHLQSLNNEITTTKSELATEKLLKAEAEARNTEIQRQHNDGIERLKQLEAARKIVEEENTDLLDQIQNLNTETEIENDPNKAVAGFATQSRSINRMLESISRGQRPGNRRPAADRGTEARASHGS